MLAEALKYLDELFRVAHAPIPLPVPTDPRTLHYVINGTHQTIGLTIPPREHKAGCLIEIIELANRFQANDGSLPDDSSPVIWYGETAVMLVIDDEHYRANTVTLTLEVSDVFKCLQSLRGRKFDQKAFVRLLRVDLARTLDPVILLEQVRKLKFEAGQVTSGHIGRGAESLGKEISAKVAQGGDIPEQVTLAAPVYKTVGETEPFPVRCAVEIDPMSGTFELLPLPDELEYVRSLALASIGRRLDEGLSEGIPAYHGNP